MTSCGHPAPLLLSPEHSVTALRLHPAPPLGVGVLVPSPRTLDVFTFEVGETLVLYTDGVMEARNQSGDFYPFAERAAQWTECGPEPLLRHIRRDLLAHVGGRLGDDAALIALRRAPTHSGHHLARLIRAESSRGRVRDSRNAASEQVVAWLPVRQGVTVEP